MPACARGRTLVTSAWQELSALGAYRITEIPRPASTGADTADSGRGDTGRTRRMAALVAAYHAAVVPKGNGSSGAIAFGWVRHAAGGPVQVLAAGAGLVGGEDHTEVYLTLPGGARARRLPSGMLTRLLSQLPSWRTIGAISDGLLPENQRPDGVHSASFAGEGLLEVWPGPFGWLVIAEPLGAAQIQIVADDVARREQLSTGDSDRFPERAMIAHRLKLRHTELRKGISTGLWRVRVLAGGADADAASRVAGLVCASADVADLPYALAPVSGAVASLRELLADPTAASPGGDAVLGCPFHASTDLLAALARPPEHEIPGVRLALRPDFDVTQEPAASREAIAIGEVLDRGLRPAGPLVLPLDSLNRHVFVCGATGAGKSQTVRTLLEEATRAGIPWLVVELAKAEYRLMAVRLGGEVVRIRPGESDAIAAGLNPLEPAPDENGNRFPLQTHANLVKALFLAAFRSEEPFPQVLSAALTRAYEEAGWDLVLGEPVVANAAPSYPGLADLQRAAERVVTEIGYSQRVTDDVLGFIRVRLLACGWAPPAASSRAGISSTSAS